MKFEDLKGKVLNAIEGLSVGSDKVVFETNEGRRYEMYHSQDCCESVRVEEIVGDLEDILNSPILLAEEVSDGETPEGHTFKYEPDSFTWTFYKLSTIKGSLTIRWLGESNGYYSESVEFHEEGKSRWE